MFCSRKLKKIKQIKHFFFSRKNGFSKGIYKGLNCGKGSNDKKGNIKKNLDYVAKKMDVDKDKLILMHQTHSNNVVEIKKNNYKKKIVADAMITNFHLPKSSLFVLVCAYYGIDDMHRAYESAMDNNYRFYSYGDACFICGDLSV